MSFTIIFGTLSFPLAAASVRGRREKLVVLELRVVQKQVKTPNSSLQERCRWNYIGRKGAAPILDAILNYTLLPRIWNGYPIFFLNLLWVPYKDQESKSGDI